MRSMSTTAPLHGVLRRHEPMSRHTSWRVGGPAAQFYLPADVDDLAQFIAALPPDEELHWLGLGSNLLVRDGGIDGTVICTNGVLNAIRALEHNRIWVEVGVACPKVARQCARLSLQGAEFLCGIPGTFGGALAMNAGAFGGQTWDIVESVLMLDRQGRLHERSPQDFQVAYRQVRGKCAPLMTEEWFVAATLKLDSGDSEEITHQIKTLLAQRGASQPTQQANAGSVFCNPPGDYAARLIESCGLKGMCIGGACVSDKHANFIINTGTASAADIEALIEKVAHTVLQIHAVELRCEVRVVGALAHQRDGRSAERQTQ